MFENIIDYVYEQNIENMIGAIVVYIMTVIVNKIYNKFRNTKSGHVLDNKDFLDHDYFIFLDNFIEYTKGAKTFSNEKEKEIYVTFINSLFSNSKKRFQKLFSNKKFIKYDQSKIKAVLLSEIKLVREDYRAECEELGIPKAIMEEFGRYASIFTPNVIDELTYILDNTYYNTNYAKLHAILDLFKFILILYSNIIKDVINKQTSTT